eukprot:gene8739-687_t
MSSLKQIKLAQDKRIYTAWVNAQFQKYRKEPIIDLFEEFKTGLKLGELLLILSKEDDFDGKTLNHEIKNKIVMKENISLLLDWLQKHQKVKLSGIGASDIVDGKEISILSLVKSIILKYQIENTGSTEDRQSAKADHKKALIQYLNEEGAPYSIKVDKISTACHDGLLLYALIHRLNRDALKFSEIEKLDPVIMNQNAINYAHELFKIPPIITGEDITTNPDEVIMMCYLSYFRETKFVQSVYRTIKLSMGISIIEKIPKVANETREHFGKRLWRNLEDQMALRRIDIKKVHENIDLEIQNRQKNREKEIDDLIERNKQDEKRIPIFEQKYEALKEEYESNYQEQLKELKEIQDKTAQFLVKENKDLEIAEEKLEKIIEDQMYRIKYLEKQLQDSTSTEKIVNPLIEERNTSILSSIEHATEEQRKKFIIPGLIKKFPYLEKDNRIETLAVIYKDLPEKVKLKKLIPLLSEFTKDEEGYNSFNDVLIKANEEIALENEINERNARLNEEQQFLKEMDKSRFLFVGKPTYENVPTFYFIFHRLSKTLLDQPPKFVDYVLSKIKKYFSGTYIIIFDLTWFAITDMDIKLLNECALLFISQLKLQHYQNLEKLILIQPTNLILKMCHEMILFLDEVDLDKKLVIYSNWHQLEEYIDPKKIFIPFISKKYLSIKFDVMKVSSKAKLQKREIKITHESILNIENGRIKSEIFFVNIKEIRKRKPDPEILVRFVHKPDDDHKIITVSNKSTLHQSVGNELQTIRYVFQTEVERDAMLDSLMTSSIRESSLSYKQTYKILKINAKNPQKRDNRVLKLTNDSIFVIADKQIKIEIPFTMINSFYIQDLKKDKLHIEYELEGEKKCYIFICKGIEDVRDSIADAIIRFMYDVKLEHELFKSTQVNQSLVKLYDAFMPKEFKDFDHILWLEVFLLPAYIEEILNFFAKFKTDKENKVPLTVATIKDISNRYKLDLNDEDVRNIIEVWDSRGDEYFTYDDVVCGWIFLKRQREVIEKKKKYAAMLKKKISNRMK